MTTGALVVDRVVEYAADDQDFDSSCRCRTSIVCTCSGYQNLWYKQRTENRKYQSSDITSGLVLHSLAQFHMVANSALAPE